jgi:hypothetical protein
MLSGWPLLYALVVHAFAHCVRHGALTTAVELVGHGHVIFGIQFGTLKLIAK